MFISFFDKNTRSVENFLSSSYLNSPSPNWRGGRGVRLNNERGQEVRFAIHSNPPYLYTWSCPQPMCINFYKKI